MRQTPSKAAAEAAVNAFMETTPSSPVATRVAAVLEAAYEVDGRQAGKTAEVMMAVALLMILAAFLVDFSVWIL